MQLKKNRVLFWLFILFCNLKAEATQHSFIENNFVARIEIFGNSEFDAPSADLNRIGKNLIGKIIKFFPEMDTKSNVLKPNIFIRLTVMKLEIEDYAIEVLVASLETSDIILFGSAKSPFGGELLHEPLQMERLLKSISERSIIDRTHLIDDGIITIDFNELNSETMSLTQHLSPFLKDSIANEFPLVYEEYDYDDDFYNRQLNQLGLDQRHFRKNFNQSKKKTFDTKQLKEIKWAQKLMKNVFFEHSSKRIENAIAVNFPIQWNNKDQVPKVLNIGRNYVGNIKSLLAAYYPSLNVIEVKEPIESNPKKGLYFTERILHEMAHVVDFALAFYSADSDRFFTSTFSAEPEFMTLSGFDCKLKKLDSRGSQSAFLEEECNLKNTALVQTFSRYYRSNPLELFAETVRMFILEPSKLISTSKELYLYVLDRVFQGRPFALKNFEKLCKSKIEDCKHILSQDLLAILSNLSKNL